jgi:hypothetical protein
MQAEIMEMQKNEVIDCIFVDTKVSFFCVQINMVFRSLC